MKKELIEKLKYNEEYRIFADMSKEEQACLKEVGLENCEYLSSMEAVLEWLPTFLRHFYHNFIYRIKSDYKPEPKFLDYEIVKITEHFLGIKKDAGMKFPRRNELNSYYGLFIRIDVIPSMANFHRFFYIDMSKNEQNCIFDEVARLINDSKNVYVRFKVYE